MQKRPGNAGTQRPTRRRETADSADEGRAAAGLPGKTEEPQGMGAVERPERPNGEAPKPLRPFASSRENAARHGPRGKRNPTGSSECQTKNFNNYSTHSSRTQAQFQGPRKKALRLAWRPFTPAPPSASLYFSKIHNFPSRTCSTMISQKCAGGIKASSFISILFNNLDKLSICLTVGFAPASDSTGTMNNSHFQRSAGLLLSTRTRGVIST